MKGFIFGSFVVRVSGKVVIVVLKKMILELVRVLENVGSVVRMNVAKHNVSTQFVELFKIYGCYFEL